jgi:hypothetical protein
MHAEFCLRLNTDFHETYIHAKFLFHIQTFRLTLGLNPNFRGKKSVFNLKCVFQSVFLKTFVPGIFDGHMSFPVDCVPNNCKPPLIFSIHFIFLHDFLWFML